MLARTRLKFETQMLCGDRVEFCPEDTLEIMANMADDCVDSIVTVPPPLVSNQIWTEGLRVLKPGNYFAAVSSPQNCSTLSCAIEDAGFDNRRTILVVHKSDPISRPKHGNLFAIITIISARKPLIGAIPDQGHPSDDRFPPSSFFHSGVRADDPLGVTQWLVRQGTPKGGIVLDPFGGCGTTAEAALREGCFCILIEDEKRFQNDIRRRFAIEQCRPRNNCSVSNQK